MPDRGVVETPDAIRSLKLTGIEVLIGMMRVFTNGVSALILEINISIF